MDATRNTTNGITDLYLNDVRQSRVLARPHLPAYLALEKIDQYAHADIHVHLVSLHQPLLLCWDGVDEYDCSLFEAYLSF